MKKMQLPHTCSRKGYARLAEEMVLVILNENYIHNLNLFLIDACFFFKRKSCLDSSSVTRIALLAKAHRKKDENPVNSQVTETLVKLHKLYH